MFTLGGVLRAPPCAAVWVRPLSVGLQRGSWVSAKRCKTAGVRRNDRLKLVQHPTVVSERVGVLGDRVGVPGETGEREVDEGFDMPQARRAGHSGEASDVDAGEQGQRVDIPGIAAKMSLALLDVTFMLGSGTEEQPGVREWMAGRA